MEHIYRQKFGTGLQLLYWKVCLLSMSHPRMELTEKRFLVGYHDSRMRDNQVSIARLAVDGPENLKNCRNKSCATLFFRAQWRMALSCSMCAQTDLWRGAEIL